MSPSPGFTDEARENVTALEAGVLGLEAGGDTSASTPAEQVAPLFRAAHNLKGMAAMEELDELSTVAHRMETVLDHHRRTDEAVDRATVDALLAGCDALAALVEAAEAGVDGPDTTGVLATLDATVARLDPPAGSAAAATPAAPPPAPRPPLPSPTVPSGASAPTSSRAPACPGRARSSWCAAPARWPTSRAPTHRWTRSAPGSGGRSPSCCAAATTPRRWRRPSPGCPRWARRRGNRPRRRPSPMPRRRRGPMPPPTGRRRRRPASGSTSTGSTSSPTRWVS